MTAQEGREMLQRWEYGQIRYWRVSGCLLNGQKATVISGKGIIKSKALDGCFSEVIQLSWHKGPSVRSLARSGSRSWGWKVRKKLDYMRHMLCSNLFFEGRRGEWRGWRLTQTDLKDLFPPVAFSHYKRVHLNAKYLSRESPGRQWRNFLSNKIQPK